MGEQHLDLFAPLLCGRIERRAHAIPSKVPDNLVFLAADGADAVFGQHLALKGQLWQSALAARYFRAFSPGAVLVGSEYLRLL